jgi:hypothetical protein
LIGAVQLSPLLTQMSRQMCGLKENALPRTASPYISISLTNGYICICTHTRPPTRTISRLSSSSSRRARHALIAFAADERNRNAPPFSFHRHHQQGGISAAPGRSFGKGGGEGRPGVGFLRHKRSPASGLTKEKLRGARGDWAASLRERSSFSLQPFWIDLRGIRR